MSNGRGGGVDSQCSGANRLELFSLSFILLWSCLLQVFLCDTVMTSAIIVLTCFPIYSSSDAKITSPDGNHNNNGGDGRSIIIIISSSSLHIFYNRTILILVINTRISLVDDGCHEYHCTIHIYRNSVCV